MIIKSLSTLFILITTTLCAQKVMPLEEKAHQELEKGNCKKALNLYNQLILQKPNDIAYLQNRARSFLCLNQFSNAINDCNKAMDLDSNSERKYYTLYVRGESYYQLENWQKAFTDYDRCAAFYLDDLDFELRRTATLYKLRRYEEAIRSCTSILKRKGITTEQIIEAYEWLGFCYMRMDNLAESKVYYHKIISLDSLSSSALYLYAAIHSTEDNEDKAIACYTKILVNDSNEVTALLNRGIKYNSIKRYELAMKDLKKYMAKTNDRNKAIYELAASYVGLKNYNKAINYYFSCLKSKPGSSVINNQISWTFFLSGNFTEGLKYANASILLDTKNENAFDTRGCIYYKLGKFDLAIDDFNKALELDSLYTNSYYYRSHCYFKTKKFTQACDDLRKMQQDKKYDIHEKDRSIETLIEANCN